MITIPPVHVLVHEGREWLVDRGLSHLMDDPYTSEEVLTLIERHYPRAGGRPAGLGSFAFDLSEGDSAPDRDRDWAAYHALNRDKRLRQQREYRDRVRERNRLTRTELLRETQRTVSPTSVAPDLIGEYKARRRARRAA